MTGLVSSAVAAVMHHHPTSTQHKTSMQHPAQEVGGPTVYVMMDKDSSTNSFANKTANGLSIAHITLGVISMFCQIILIYLSKTYPGSYENIISAGEGIYCGVFFVIAGCLGLLACHKPTTCNISAFMTLSIIASIFSAAQIILDSFNLIGISISGSYHIYRSDVRGEKIGLFSVMILASLVEGIIAIMSSAVCCRACCCTGAPSLGKVVYLSQGGSAPPASQVPVQFGFIPQPVPVIGHPAPVDQLPSYEDVVQEQLDVKEKEKSGNGGYMRF